MRTYGTWYVGRGVRQAGLRVGGQVGRQACVGRKGAGKQGGWQGQALAERRQVGTCPPV